MGEAGETRRRKAWRVSVKGYDHSSIIHAPTAGKARMEVWYSVNDCGVRIVDIMVRRAAESDVLLPPRSPIVDLMTKEEVGCLIHAFGGDSPSHAGYRDYFYTSRDDPPLLSLTPISRR